MLLSAMLHTETIYRSDGTGDTGAKQLTTLVQYLYYTGTILLRYRHDSNTIPVRYYYDTGTVLEVTLGYRDW